MSGPVVTLGEPIVALLPDGPVPFAEDRACRWSVGGAELNVAVGLRRLGVDVHLIARVGDDPLGRMVTDHLRAEGLTTDGVVVDDASHRVLPARVAARRRAPADLLPHRLGGQPTLRRRRHAPRTDALAPPPHRHHARAEPERGRRGAVGDRARHGAPRPDQLRPELPATAVER